MGKRGLAHLSRALRLGRRGGESEARTPDHLSSCLVAQSRVTVTLPKQAKDNKRTLAYSVWPSPAIGPHSSKVSPSCTLVAIVVANSSRLPYNTASPVQL